MEKPIVNPDKPLPFNADAEIAVLSAMFHNPQAVVPEVLHLEHEFYVEKNRILFAAIVAIVEAGRPVTFVELQTNIESDGNLERVGGRSRIADLMEAKYELPSLKILPFFTGLIEEAWRKRSLAESAAKAYNSALNGGASKDVVQSIQTDIEALKGIKRSENQFPEIISARKLIEGDSPLPEVLINGLLHRGEKLLLTGGSKSCKSWALLDLALAMAGGSEFFGMSCKKGRVLLVNMEIDECFITSRIKKVNASQRQGKVPKCFDTLNLRGHTEEVEKFIPRLIAILENKDLAYDLIIIDPIYKILGNRDENSARDIGDLFRELEILTCKTGAAIALAHHHSKGRQTSKGSLDRASGSGVFARDPDVILDLVGQNSNLFTVTATLRNFEPLPSFCVEWNFPRFSATERLASVPRYTRNASAKEVAAILEKDKLKSGEWEKRAKVELSIGKTRFYALKKECYETGLVVECEERKYRRSDNFKS